MRITRLDFYGHLFASSPAPGEHLYQAAAYFRGDPFLARAGAIGTIKSMRASDPNTVREACIQRVVWFLTQIVREDTFLAGEDEELQLNIKKIRQERFAVKDA